MDCDKPFYVYMVEIDRHDADDPRSDFGGIYRSLEAAMEGHDIHKSRLKDFEPDWWVAEYRDITFQITRHEVQE